MLLVFVFFFQRDLLFLFPPFPLPLPFPLQSGLVFGEQHLERLLFRRTETESSGAVGGALQAAVGEASQASRRVCFPLRPLPPMPTADDFCANSD